MLNHFAYFPIITPLFFSFASSLIVDSPITTRGNLSIVEPNAFSVLPPSFSRASPGDPFNTTFWQTLTPSSPSTQALINQLAPPSRTTGKIIAFDQEFSDGVDTATATVQRVAVLPDADQFVTEGPVWLDASGELLFFPLQRQNQYLFNPQNGNLRSFVADPPVESPNGATLHSGIVYLATVGFNASSPPSLVTLDPNTLQSNVILNNYRGIHFNGLDDLIVDSQSRIWFTDFGFGAPLPPQFGLNTYNFDPKTGVVKLVEDTLVAPNGLAFSPNGDKLYLGDSGIFTGPVDLPRTIYSFDVNPGATLSNRTALHITDSGAPDGVKVAASGHVLTVGAFPPANGSSVDIISPNDGRLLAKIAIPSVCNNLAFGGASLSTLFVTCFGELWAVTGLRLNGNPIV